MVFTINRFLQDGGNYTVEVVLSDPRELSAQGEIIVVTIQYRLGSFGFLFLDDEKVPGNVGIMDQKMGKNVNLLKCLFKV